MPIPIPELETRLKPRGLDRLLVRAATAGAMDTAHNELIAPPRNAEATSASSPLTRHRSANAAGVPRIEILMVRVSPSRRTIPADGRMPATLPRVRALAMYPR